MIFVDTSVWVEAFRGTSRRTGTTLAALLDAELVALAAPVRLEILAGASLSTIGTLRRVLSALPVFYPVRDTWLLIERWVEVAARSGQRFGIGDLLIAAMTAERGGQVWSLDGDFKRMARLGFVKNYLPKRK